MVEIDDACLCPYCLKPHPASQSECPTTNLAIPKAYIRAQQEHVRIANMLTIGYSGHGKTCYLAAFMHALYYGDPVRRWSGFSFIGLNQATLDQVHKAYVNALQQGILPRRSNNFMGADSYLTLKMDDVPLARKVGPIVVGYRPRGLLLNMFDIGGEVYEAQETIQSNIEIISRLRNLVLLVDLKSIRSDEQETGAGPVQKMHNLLNTVLNALDELGQKRRKGIVVCFTKADQLWDQPDYGPLSQRPQMPLAGADAMKAYVGELRRRSRTIGDWVRAQYPQFHNSLKAYFKPVAFTAVSALGQSPEGGDGGKTIARVQSSGLVDPLLLLLRMDGWL